jgi:F420-dependent oxidoreductase-like protein
MVMRYGIFVPQGWKRDLNDIESPVDQFEAMINVAKVADELPAIDSVWVYDHFHTVPTPEHETTFECWTATTALVRETKRVFTGQMVGCNGYRNPSLYAKIASTVDVASHGRLYAGFGAGWYEHEWRAYGYEWDETKIRMQKFREAVEIINKMWTEDYPSYSGKHYHIDKLINEPKNSGKGKVPLWLGGGGEQVTLKLVAQYAEACNVGGGNAEIIRQKLEVLKRHCDAVGRNYDEIVKSTSIEPMIIVDKESDAEEASRPHRRGATLEEWGAGKWTGTPEQIAANLSELQAAGTTYVIAYFPRAAYDQSQIRQFAEEIIPMVGK